LPKLYREGVKLLKKKILIMFVLVFSGFYATASVAHEGKDTKDGTDHHHHPHKHKEPKELTPEKAAFFLKKWESPKRDKWQMPDKIVEELGIKPGWNIADIGSGGGYFTVRFSRAVGTEGKVYAVDVEKLYLEYMAKRIEEKNISNVELVHAKYDDPLLARNSLDMIFICNAWHHIKSREGYIWKLYRALKPDGRLVVVEFRYQQPQIKRVNLDHRIPRNQTLKLAREGGFKLHGEYFFLPRQYLLILKKVLFPPE
jgi:precorrin-6B methylase 2